jgi:ABC-type maltose transport system permease subunit
MLMVGSVLMLVPVLALFFAAQQYFVKGVALTGLAGR